MILKSNNISQDIKQKIIAPIPEYLIQQREGGGKKMLSYLSGSTVIDMLNDAFGYTWSWNVTREWIEQSIPYFNQYSKASDSEKIRNPITGKVGAWEEQGPVAHVKGILKVFLRTEDGTVQVIEKEGYGSKSILGKQNDQESIYKAASTDALKKAASLFGIGLELYRNEDEQAYFNEINYDDPWTEEVTEKLANELTEFNEIINKKGYSDEDLAQIVYDATQNDYSVTPDNLMAVLEYLRSL